MRGLSISVRIRLSILLLLLLTLALVMFGMTRALSRSQMLDNLTVNLAGRQRMRAQEIVKETLMYLALADSERVELAAGVAKQIVVFVKTHTALAGERKVPVTLDPDGPSAVLALPRVASGLVSSFPRRGRLVRPIHPISRLRRVGRGRSG